MRTQRTHIRTVISLTAIFGAAVLCWLFAPISVWAELSTKVFTLLSVGTAAVLVRLARTSPFSNPDVFEDVAEIERYFDALRLVQVRLSVILFVLIGSFFGLALAALSATEPLASAHLDEFWKLISALNGGLVALLINRTIAVVQGDISFINLQSRIMTQAKQRKKQPNPDPRPAPETKSWRSAGYGRLSGN